LAYQRRCTKCSRMCTQGRTLCTQVNWLIRTYSHTCLLVRYSHTCLPTHSPSPWLYSPPRTLTPVLSVLILLYEYYLPFISVYVHLS
jgi:hypothetical protein